MSHLKWVLGTKLESSEEQQLVLAAPELAFWGLLLAFETGLQYVTLTDLKVIYLPLLRLKAYAAMPSSLELFLNTKYELVRTVSETSQSEKDVHRLIPHTGNA